ncbi:MAG: stimulus-sensing domain-containing protein [Hyphomicrobiales bacterium]
MYRVRRVFRILGLQASSSLVRRIIVLNLVGLVALLAGFLYLNQFREGLIDARVQSLLIQGEIIAGAIAGSATVETDSITIDPERLLQMQAGESIVIGGDEVQFSINPARVAPLLRRLVTPTRTRARIYDLDAGLLLDSASLYSRGDILKYDLAPPEKTEKTIFERTWNLMKHGFGAMTSKPIDEVRDSSGRSIPEISRALGGLPASTVRVNSLGDTTVSVAVPIQRSRLVKGVLLLSTLGGDIDSTIDKERMAIFRIFGVAAAVMVIVSAVFAGTIAGPIRKLSAAADRVRRGVKIREEIPDFTDRSDEIGQLSGSLSEMTKSLYNRIEAIESFAADVAHELKNPLTSLRSAVETWPLAKTDDSRARLLDVIQHDVRRLDRLISDISSASRLDAELARADAQNVDVGLLAEAVTGVANSISRDINVSVKLDIERSKHMKNQFIVTGHDSRLGQVLTNVIENACSFSPVGGLVRVSLTRRGSDVEIVVEDDGPGIPTHALEKVFQRFYTDRPEQGFGQNSGLGLSISRQIVAAHHGLIWAENRYAQSPHDPDATPIGARFVIRLPATP